MVKSHTAKLANIILMAGICKDMCKEYKITERYVQGVVRCKYCEVFMKWEGLWCPCCGCRVSRKSRYKRKPRTQYNKDMAKKRKKEILETCMSAWKHERIRHETRRDNIAYEQKPLIEVFRNCFKPLLNK